MYQDRKSESANKRAKKKVSRQFLQALKTTQNMPLPHYAKYPGEGLFPERMIPPHPHDVHRRANQHVEHPKPQGKGNIQIKVSAPPKAQPIDDILQDDIEKIAYDGKDKSKLRPPTETKKEARQQPKEPKLSENIYDRPTTQHTLVQSLLYPSQQGEHSEKQVHNNKPITQEPLNLNRSYEQIPRDPLEGYLPREYDHLYRTDRKAERKGKRYAVDPYYDPRYTSDSRSPEYYQNYPPQYFPSRPQRHSEYPPQEIPPTRQELYEYYASKHNKTLPSYGAYEDAPYGKEDALYYEKQHKKQPPQGRGGVVYNQPKPNKSQKPSRELKNITNKYEDPLIQEYLNARGKEGGRYEDYGGMGAYGKLLGYPAYTDRIYGNQKGMPKDGARYGYGGKGYVDPYHSSHHIDKFKSGRQSASFYGGHGLLRGSHHLYY